MNYNFNEEQQEVIKSTEKKVFVLAGAGTGKTATLTELINNNFDKEIIAVTFTNRAAKEMKARISDKCTKTKVSTFHSFAFNKCKEIGKFTMSDDNMGEALVKSIIKNETNLESRGSKKIFNQIKYFKNKGIIDSKEINDVGELDCELNQFKIVFDTYNDTLKKSSFLDFEDVIIKAAQLEYDLDYVLVDEFQDVNKIEIDLLNKMSEKSKRVFVFGDDSQSIYGWRGADDNFKYLSDYKIYKLVKNYRSSKEIIDKAQEVIRKNKHFEKKEIVSCVDTQSEIISKEFEDGRDEAKFVVEKIKELNDFNNTAILYRSKGMMNSITKLLEEENIPISKEEVTKKKPQSLIDQQSILRMFVNYSNLSICGGIEFLDSFTNNAKNSVLSISNEENIFENISIEHLIEKGFSQQDAILLVAFKINIMKAQKIFDLEDKEKSLKDFKTFLTNFCKAFELKNVQFDYDLIFNNDESVEVQINNFLQLSGNSDEPEIKASKTQGITMLTIHTAKGLEFKNVFLVGVENGIYEDTDESRRVLYVGMTRAKEKLFITWTKTRYIYGSVRESGPFIS